MKRRLFPGMVVVAIVTMSAAFAAAESFSQGEHKRRDSAGDSSFFELPEVVLRFDQSAVQVDFAQEGEELGPPLDNLGPPIDDFGAAEESEPESEDECESVEQDCEWCGFCERPGEITFKAGARIQGRYLYNQFGDNNNDFFIRRFRMKGSGDVYDVGKYGMELKTDSSERFNAGVPHNPTPVVENAWVDFKIHEDLTYLRVGLYDIPFSRNALTSDSKLLLMDRSLIKGALTSIGMADNTVGLMLHGRPLWGPLEYSVGLFDNIRFDRTGKQSDNLMPAGRIALNLLDPPSSPEGYADYKESYLGQGQRLDIGANFAFLSGVREFDPTIMGPISEFDVYAWGVDLFFNYGAWVFQAEYDWFREDFEGGTPGPDLRGEGWYAQFGYILSCCWEFAARYQRLEDPITPLNGSPEVEWTSVGANYYIHAHNLKIQTDYTWKNEDAMEIDNDIFQVQLQLDF